MGWYGKVWKKDWEQKGKVEQSWGKLRNSVMKLWGQSSKEQCTVVVLYVQGF